MNENQIYLSTNLKHLRNNKGVKLEDVAKSVDKTPTAISYWENGLREPSAVDLAKLCNYYGISPSEMLLKDLRFENEIKLDEEHILNNVILDKTKDLSAEDKKKIIDIIDIYKN